MFTRATKAQSKLRLALIGPAGAGKTYTALAIATALGKRIAVMDTERGSASKYSDLFTFDTVTPEQFHPNTYIDVICAAEDAGYDVLIIDSLSHAWSGKGGALEMVDNVARRDRNNNSYTAWRDVTPHHNAMVDAIVGARLHIIATMRTKMEYVQEKDERGKTVVRKVGMQPVQRDGLEYEFDVVADLNQDNDLIIGKTRCPQLYQQIFHQAGADVAAILTQWLTEGAPPPPDVHALQARVKLLREAERDLVAAPPPFTWRASQGPTPLEAEIDASRGRLLDALHGRGGDASDPEELSDTDLIVLVRERAPAPAEAPVQ